MPVNTPEAVARGRRNARRKSPSKLPSVIEAIVNPAWQFAWTFPPRISPAARYSFRSVDRHVCRVCRDSLDSLLHTPVVDVVRSHRCGNHVPDRRNRKSCEQLRGRSSESEMSNGKKLELVRGLGPWT